MEYQAKNNFLSTEGLEQNNSIKIIFMFFSLLVNATIF